MKKLFMMLVVLFIIYLGIQFLFTYFSHGHDDYYELQDGNVIFSINEKSTFKQNIHNYLYKIKVEDREFDFQIDYDFDKLPKVIKEIKYYKDNNYECLLPIFKNNIILVDMMCYNGKTLTYYYNLKGKNNNLDQFVESITTYNKTQFVDSAIYQTIEQIDVYKDNLIKNHYIGLTNYKGIYDISSNFNSIVYRMTLYENDIYNQKIGSFVDGYYISADYNEQYEFNKINVIDLIRLDVGNIISNTKISLDGYIQGLVDTNVYLYDKDNKVQYEINPAKKTIVKYSNEIKYYKDNNWSNMSVSDANAELKFSNSVDYKDDEYVRIDKVGSDVGYYYLYKQNGSNYDVYRISIQNKDGLIYLFSTKNVDNIYYISNYVYFVDGNKIKVFNDQFGVRNVVSYSELEFNKTINFAVFSS